MKLYFKRNRRCRKVLTKIINTVNELEELLTVFPDLVLLNYEEVEMPDSYSCFECNMPDVCAYCN